MRMYEKAHLKLALCCVLSQRLRETLNSVRSEKDKEIAFLRGQLAAYTSMPAQPQSNESIC